MDQFVRHRLVHAISPSLLRAEVAKLVKEGWRLIGEPTLAAPVDLNRPPYWVQAMYLAKDEIPNDSITAEDPRNSETPPEISTD